jgi:hypothetical protein
LIILNFTENRPEGVKSENYVKNKESILKNMMKNRLKRKEKNCAPTGV